ncbi:MAG: hypothetical protein ABS965_00555 [Succiniclasticum sp.]
MKLGYYYFLSWLSGVLTLVFSVGGALAFVTYIGSPSTVDGIVRPGHMSVMEFVLPLFLIGFLCVFLYLCLSLYCIFRKLRTQERRVLHFLLNLVLYLVTAIGTVPLLILLFNK